MSLPPFLRDMDASIYESDNYVVLDWETDTSHGDHGSAIHPANGILLGSWKLGKGHSSYLGYTTSQFGSEFDFDELLRHIEEADFLIAHNAKYELMWLKRCGLDLHKTLVYDTKIAEYVLFGNLAAGDKNMAGASTSLDMCCRRRYWDIKDPVVDTMIKHGINPISIPRPWIQGRCEQDVRDTERLYLDQLARLQSSDRLGLVFTRCLLTSALSSMEFSGMFLDADRVQAEYLDYKAQYLELTKKMDALTGGINWRSSLQRAEFMYDVLKFKELTYRGGKPQRTESGKRKTDKNTLEKLKASTPEQKEYVSLKAKLGAVGDALSKNLEFFVGTVDEHKGLFHAEFNQTVTATHRLSSSGIRTQFEAFDKPKRVQFQNLPRVFKRLFTSRNEGWQICETDGSQLEFRVAAHLGRDDQARMDILDPDFDAHLTSAAAMEDKDYTELLQRYRNGDKWVKTLRQKAKSETFKPLYGGEYGTKKQMRWYKAFAERYDSLTAAQKGWVQEVLATRRLITEWGLRFYWPYAKVSNTGYVNVKRAVANYPVQSLATAEIIPIAVFYFWHRVMDEGLQDKIILVNSIHDSLICEVHPDAIEDYRRISKQAFTTDVYEYLEAVYGVKFDFVPLGVGVTVGSHWSEGEEENYDIFYDGKTLHNGVLAA